MKVELNIISMNEAAPLPVLINYSPKNQNHRKYINNMHTFLCLTLQTVNTDSKVINGNTVVLKMQNLLLETRSPLFAIFKLQDTKQR